MRTGNTRAVRNAEFSKIEFNIATEDKQILVTMAAELGTTVGELVRTAIYGHYPKLHEADRARWGRVVTERRTGGTEEQYYAQLERERER